jgi:hypothetical protein
MAFPKANIRTRRISSIGSNKSKCEEESRSLMQILTTPMYHVYEVVHMEYKMTIQRRIFSTINVDSICIRIWRKR